MRTITLVLALVACGLLSSSIHAEDSPWDLRILPAESNWRYSVASGINTSGVIVGEYHGPGALMADRHAILWDGGAGYVDLSATYGAPAGLTNAVASGITDAGVAGGWAYDPAVNLSQRAIAWDTSAEIYKLIHPEGFDFSVVHDVHQAGHMVGTCWREPWVASRAYVWDPGGESGSVLDPAPDFGMSEAYGVNVHGSAAGVSRNPELVIHAMVWAPDGTPTDLHTVIQAHMPLDIAPIITHSGAFDISDEGHVLGFARDADSTVLQLWIWTVDDGIRFLDQGDGLSSTLNMLEGRFAVGIVWHAPNLREDRAAIWVDGILHELPVMSGFVSMGCKAINIHGVAAGNAVLEGHVRWWQGSRAYVAEPSENDFDGDSLSDAWELRGYTHDNGKQVDLPAMGANPLQRDLFVEIDAMVGGGYDHRPDPETLQPVVDAFAAHDIALHVHIDADVPLDGALGTLDGLGRYQWDEFDALKAAHFDEELESAVRYCVFGHRLATLTDSGLARGEPSSDFIVSLGAFVESSGSTDPWMQAGTFMHELGHTLGLRHGGADVTNQKPNYLSVMNYDYQKQGLRIDGEDGHFDYSQTRLADLDEGALVEGAGLGIEPLVAGHQTLFRVVTLDPITFQTTVVAVWSGDVRSAIDWNGSGGIEGVLVSADINGNGAMEILKGNDDWSSLDFHGGTVGFGVGLPPPPPPPETEVVEELTVEEAKLIPPPGVEGLAGRAGRGSVRLSWTAVGPYGQGLYRVYRWSATQPRALVAETEASLISDRPGPGTWYYAVTVTDMLGVTSIDSQPLVVRVR